MSNINIDLKQLFTAGVHFGHFKSRWHPNMKSHIHSVRSGRCIINLESTKQALEQALPAVSQVASEGKNVLFVGTKRQTKKIVQTAAESVDMPYVVNRWVGGMLTNYQTINVQIKKLKNLERRMASGELSNKYNKLEVLKYQKQIDNLNNFYGGIKEMALRPAMVFITDMQVNAIAVTEANKLKIPIVAMADTNVDPTLATYPIPANDDALRSLETIVDFIIQAIRFGRSQIKAEPQAIEKTKEEK